MDYKTSLIKYGLSEKESLVYIALLKSGPATVNQIAESADLVRTTTYDILKKLREEGIVASFDKNNIRHFEAADPEKLIQILDERKKYVTQILSDLKKLKKEVPDMPRSEIFEGKHGLKTVFQILLTKKKPLYAYSNNEAMTELMPYFAPRFINDRVKAKIPIKIISEESKTTDVLLKEKDKKEFRETRTINNFNKLLVNQYMTDDVVAILGTRADEPIGIVIHHKDFARAQRIIFEQLWQKAKK